MQPLDDITVLDLSLTLPGPYATKLLMQLGAEVVSIEPPGGDALRHREPTLSDGRGELYERLNRGKRSIEVDLKTDEGRTFVQTVADEADVFVEGFRPGTADSLGVGPETLCERNESLVYCSLSGYGQGGPREQQPGHALNYEGLAGLLDPENPGMPRLPVSDFAGGTMLALAVLAALRGRDRAGGGQYVDLGLFEVLASWNSWNLPWAASSEQNRDHDPLVGGEYPCYNTYETADGRYLTLGIMEQKFWETLCDRLDLPELVDRKFETGGKDSEVYRKLQTVFLERPLDAWVAEFSEEFPLAAVHTSEEAVTDPQLDARERLFAFDARTGETLREFEFPVTFSQESTRQSSPSAGDALERAGYGVERLHHLEQAGVLSDVDSRENQP